MKKVNNDKGSSRKYDNSNITASTGNRCGFSSIQSLLEGRSISISQSIIVNEIPSVTNFSSYNFNSNGCPWLMVHGNDVSQFPAAVYLNNKLGGFE